MSNRLTVRRGSSLHAEPQAAVAEIAEQIGTEALSGVLFFCSPKYDLVALGRALSERFKCPLAGCTTSGQIGPDGFQPAGITAASFSSSELSMKPFIIQPLGSCEPAATQAAMTINTHRLAGALERRAFGLVLADGLSFSEEQLMRTLYRELDNNFPIIGGSAGDDLVFKRTHVYHEGKFVHDSALFVLFETTLPFATFRFDHFAPTDQKIVVTDADPEKRIVYEINGERAAIAYAELIGVAREQLTPAVFSRHPMMLKLKDEHYVRSIQRINADHSLSFLCAIEAGFALTVGTAVDAIATADRAFAALADRVALPEVVIGCDCVLRRIQLEEEGLASQVGAIFAKNRVVGFSTYGEQFNGLHMNQTFTGVALGNWN